MNDTPQATASLKDIEAIRDLFARAHDYIAQANHPGHLSMKVGEVLAFLAFQYQDFKLRAETLTKAELSKVDVEAAKSVVDAVLVEQPEAPKV